MMDSESTDAVELLKKVEDEAAAKVESAKSEAEKIVLRAHEQASVILDNASRDAALEKQRIAESTQAQAAAETEAILSKAKVEAEKMATLPLDDRIVKSSLTEFMGDCGV